MELLFSVLELSGLTFFNMTSFFQTNYVLEGPMSHGWALYQLPLLDVLATLLLFVIVVRLIISVFELTVNLFSR